MIIINNNLSPLRGQGYEIYSTNKNSEAVSFKEATIKGAGTDKGLYFPETIPQVEKIDR
jgi:threonine synthase